MTEKARVRLGAYFLLALLLLTLPVTLLVTHINTARHAPQWVATDAGVKFINADHHASAIAWIQKNYGVSKEAAKTFAYKTEHDTRTRLDTTQTLPWGTQVDYFNIDARQTPQTAKKVASAIVERADAPLAQWYEASLKNPAWKKANPVAAADSLDVLHTSMKSGFAMIPTAFSQRAEALAKASKTDVPLSSLASTASNPVHGLKKPTGVTAKATTTHYRVAVVCTQFPGWRDIAPRSDLDTDANDTGNATQGGIGSTAIGVGYGTGGSNPGVAFPAYVPAEVSYRQDLQTIYPVPTPWNYATQINAGADATWHDEPFDTAGNDPTKFGSIYDTPGGPFSAASWGIPAGVTNPWDYTEVPTYPAPMDATNQDLANRFYSWLFDPSMTALSANNWFYQNTHGQVRIDGSTSDVLGWLTSAHVTNRYLYQTGGGNEEFIFPGTPCIRKNTSNSDFTQDQIVRASLSGNGLTILFSHPMVGPKSFNIGNLSLNVWTNSTLTSGTDGPPPVNYKTAVQGGYVTINFSTLVSSYTVRMDPYDNRRWTIINTGGTGFKYQYLSGVIATPTVNAASWVPVEGSSWNLAYGTYTDTAGTTLTAPGIPTNSSAYAPQNQNVVHNGESAGCPRLGVGQGAGDPYPDSTEICDADMHVASFDTGAQIAGGSGNPAVTFDNRPFARLRTFNYYTHNYMGAGTAYQISHLYTVGPSGALYADDIAGTTYTGGEHIQRPPPFDHNASDPANGGYWSMAGEKNSGNHRQGKYVGDVQKILTDNGLSLTGYNSTIYVAADNNGNPGTGVGEANGLTATFQPNSGLTGQNESTGLGTYFHELAHAYIGTSDLYDNNFYDNMASPPPVPTYHQCNAMGPYSIMAAGGRVDAWHLVHGIVPPTVVTQDTLGADIPEIEGLMRDPVILKLPANPYYIKKGVAPGTWKEYFLVENRNVNSGDGNGAYGIDSSTKGLYIYHIDERSPISPGYGINGAGFQRDDALMTVMVEQSDGWHELEYSDTGQATRTTTDPFGNLVTNGTNVSRFWQWPVMDGDVNDFGSVVNLPDIPTPQAGNGWSRVGAVSPGSPTSYSHGYTNSELSGGSNTIINGTATDSFARVVKISNPGVDMYADLYVQPAEIRVVGTSLTPATVQQGQTNVGIMKLTLQNRQDLTPGKTDQSRMSTQDVYVDTLNVLESGTSNNGTDIAFAKLYADTNGNDVFDGPPTDSLLATTTIVTNPLSKWYGYAVFDSLGYRVPLSTVNGEHKTLFIAYDIAPEAQTNPFVTVGAEFTDASKIQPRLPGTVEVRQRRDGNPGADNAADLYNFGPTTAAQYAANETDATAKTRDYFFPVYSDTAVIHNWADRLVVTQPTPYAASSATPGQANLPLLRMRLETNRGGTSRTQGYTRVQKLMVDATPDPTTPLFSAPSELTNAVLYEDQNHDGVINTGDILLGTSSFTIAGGLQQATFLNLNEQVLAGSANAKDLLVGVNVAPGATVGNKFSLSVKFPTPGPWTTAGDQEGCYVQLVNATGETAPNKDYVEFANPVAGDNVAWPIASTTTTIINPDQAPNRPITGFSPTAGQVIFNQNPTLVWDPATDPDVADTPQTLSYDVDLATDGTFNNMVRPEITVGPNVTQWIVTAPVLPATTYYWRVRTRDSSGMTSTWSDIQQFIVQVNAPPNRINAGFTVDTIPEPPNVSVTTLTPVLAWNATNDPNSPNAGDRQAELVYELQIDDNADFSSTNVDWTGAAGVTTFGQNADWSSPAVSAPLVWGVQYYWRVRAADGHGMWSAWTSDVPGAINLWFRTVQDRSPSSPINPTLNAAAMVSGMETLSANPVLGWGMPVPPDPDLTDTLPTIHYEVELDTSPDLALIAPGSFVYELTTANNALSATVNTVSLLDNTHYYWRVRAIDDEGAASPWTAIQDFWVNTVNNAPTPPSLGFDPVNASTVNTTTPTLSWDNSADPDVDPYDGAYTNGVAPTQVIGVNWTIDLSQSQTFATIPYSYAVPVRGAAGDPTFTVPVALTQGVWWYWRVQAIDNDGAKSVWSATQKFMVNTAKNPPTPPTALFTPANTLSVSSLTPELQWGPGADTEDAVGLLRYEVEVSTSNTFDTTNSALPNYAYYWFGGPTANGQQLITIGSALIDTPVTTYYWHVRTVDTDNQRSTWSGTMHFTVVTNHAPNVITTGFNPTGGVQINTPFPVLNWNAAVPPDQDADDTANTITYQVEIDDNNNFNSPEYTGWSVMGATTLTDTTPLSTGVTYYWHVRAQDSKGFLQTTWSGLQSFKIVDNQAPTPPVMVFSPANNRGLNLDEVTTATPLISWGAGSDPNISDTAATLRYQIQLSDAADFSATPLVDATTPAGQTTYQVATALQDNIHYYYRLRTIDSGGLNSAWTYGTADWSLDFWCNTVNNAPTPPNQGFNPVSGATTSSTTPTLSWDNSVDCDPDPYDANVSNGPVVGVSFVVQLGTTPTLGSPIYTYPTGVGVSTLTPPVALTDGQVWYWRVKAVDNDGAASAWSGIQTLTVDTTKHAPTAPNSNFNPTGGATVSGTTPRISWGAATDIDAGQTPATLRYEVQVAEDPAFATGPGYYWNSPITAAGNTNVDLVTALTSGTTYYWRVRTIDPTNLYSPWTAGQRFVVGVNRVPNTITTMTPIGGAAVSDSTPTLTWAAAAPPDPDADDTADTLRYEVVVDNNANFGTPEFGPAITTLPQLDPLNPSIIVTTPLTVGVTYYWRVRAIDSKGAVGLWSNTGAASPSFRVIANLPPNVPIGAYVPSGGLASILTTGTPTLSWNNPNPPNPPDPNLSDTIGTIHYEVQINDSADFSAGAVLTGLTPDGQSSYDVPAATPLLDNGHYYWRVRAWDSYPEASTWSAVQDFYINTGNNAPLPPTTGFVPVTGAGIATQTPRLSWDAASDPDPGDLPATLRYQLQLSSDSFATVAYTYSTAAGITLVDVTSALTDLTTWKWRVRTMDAAGVFSVWSAIETFNVNTTNHTPTPPTSGFNPAGGRNVSDLTPTFMWNAGLDPDPADTADTLRYDFVLSDDNTFPSPAGPAVYMYSGSTVAGITTITVPDPNPLTAGKTYYWRVRTVDASNTRSLWSGTQMFVVGANNPPNPPVNGFTPANGSNVSDPTPMLGWNAATDPDANDTADVLRYEVIVDDNNDFSSPAFDRVTTAGAISIECAPATALQQGVRYYWRVITIDPQGAVSLPSTIHNFTVVANQAPYTPVAPFVPVNGVEVGSANPSLSWDVLGQPDPNLSDTALLLTYEVQVKNSSDFGAGPYAFSGTTAAGVQTIAVTTTLEDNTQYWWRVRAVDPGGLKSDWTSPTVLGMNFWVNTTNQAPQAPDSGFDPANGRQINDATPFLAWNAAFDPDHSDTANTLHYIAELTTDQTFATTSYQYTSGVGPNPCGVQVTTALTDRTRWYWRVKTVDNAGAESGWSAIQNFYLDLNNQPPTLTNGIVQPMYGALGTYYQLFVTYTDAENDPSGKVYCQFENGPTLEMSKVTPADNNAVDGIQYVVGIAGATLGLGAHNHAFSCDAGARLPLVGYDLGPVIGVASSIWFTNASGTTATTFEEGRPVYVKVQDADQNLDPAVVETVPATVTEASGDSELITLTETGPNTGIFLGSVATLGKAGARNDGKLNAIGGPAGNSLTATYQDPDDAANPAPDRATASAMLFDTIAPAGISKKLVVTSGADGRTANLDWSAYDETAQVDVAGYHVYYVPATEFTSTTGLTAVATIVPGTKTCQVTGLVPNKTYWFAVAAFDEVPNELTDCIARKLITRDITAPVISGYQPASGATEVARDTSISFYLDDPGSGVDRRTLQVDLTQNGSAVDHGAFVFEGDKSHLKVTLTPTALLQWNGVINVGVSVKDFDGNLLTVNDWSFACTTDTEKPTIDQQNPAPAAKNVPVSTTISFHLKDTKSGVDPASIQMLFNGADVSTALSTSGNDMDTSVVYDPSGLSYSSTYTVVVTARDVAGNTLGPITWRFSTVKDSSSVNIDQFNPARDAVDVPVDTNIAFRLTDPQAGIDRGTFKLVVQGVDVTNSGNLTITQTPDPSDRPTTVYVTYNPPDDLPFAADIHVRVYVLDGVGNISDLTYKFRTADAPTYSIIGQVKDTQGVALPGVTLTAGGKTTVSDGTGGYMITGLLAGTYTVTPTRSQYVFDPVSTDVVLGPDDASKVDFTGTLLTYAAHGTITEGGVGLAGVAVDADGHSAVTDADGHYTITGLANGQYTVTPSLQNYHFQPTTRAVQIASADSNGVDFTAVADTYSVSGTIKDTLGNRLQGVQVSTDSKIAVTNDAGYYIISGLRVGSYTLTPTKSGYTFNPTSQTLTVDGDKVNVDFTGLIEMANTFSAGWNFIGVPGTPADQDATHVFGTVQCYRWDPSAVPPTYRAAVNDPTLDAVKVRAGRGFFVRFSDSTTLRVAGQPTDASRTTSISLSEGWNMVANPLAMPAKWSRFVASQPDGIRPFAFILDAATGSYKMVSSDASLGADRDSLLGWEGAWVRAMSSGVSLLVSPGTGTAGEPISKPQQAGLNGGWFIPVVARAGNRADFTSIAGVVPGSDGKHMIENPPTPPHTVDVYFTTSSGQRLAHDVRSQSGAQTFNFTVACGVPDTDVTVSLPDLSRVPASQQILLTDEATGQTLYARTLSSYTYHNQAEGAERKFQLVVSPRTIGALTVTATTAAAKGDNVVLTYSVTKSCQVNIRVLNLAGRVVKMLAVDKSVLAGVQTEMWNLTSEGGTRVPAGTYLLQIDALTDSGQSVRGLTQVQIGR